MKPRFKSFIVAALLGVVFTAQLHAQNNVITYQGRVQSGGSSFTGTGQFKFALVTSTNANHQATADDGANGFEVLNPTQPLTATPYALRAQSVESDAISGTYTSAVTFNNAGNTFIGSGAGLTSLNASQLSSGTVPDARLSGNVSLLGPSISSAEIKNGTIVSDDVDDTSFSTTFWRVNGNSGTSPGTHFLGTTDDEPLDLRVNNQRALRLEPHATSPNLIGGFSGNRVGAGNVGSTIGGGGSLNNSNAVHSDYSTLAGGLGNDIGTNSSYSAIGGGLGNDVADNAPFATIPGGSGNQVGPNATNAFAAGHRARAIHPGAFV